MVSISEGVKQTAVSAVDTCHRRKGATRGRQTFAGNMLATCPCDLAEGLGVGGGWPQYIGEGPAISSNISVKAP